MHLKKLIFIFFSSTSLSNARIHSIYRSSVILAIKSMFLVSRSKENKKKKQKIPIMESKNLKNLTFRIKKKKIRKKRNQQ